jgi:glycosyl-4,4'-diaponeurosporenoate acyltransferase
MQVIYLPHSLMIASFFVFWGLYQTVIPVLCLRIPMGALDCTRGIYRTREWEHAGFYKRTFSVGRWKHLLPDGAAISRKGFRKRKLVSTDPAYLERFLAESCRAELTHWLAILPFWIFGFWAPPVIIPMMLVYALVANLPCIVTQRYNRLRIALLLERRRFRSSPPFSGPTGLRR